MQTHTILVVDDDALNRKVARLALCAAGYQVQEAATCRAALDSVAASPMCAVAQPDDHDA